ncbi:MAG: 4-hydroxy-3-methylbut-2-enyl diphosphate reductase [Planctomycetota bacterium]|nr:4-hydroxy-3-methylbut-2-enyl diphosphate reductase [Planctomycetota bacterium]
MATDHEVHLATPRGFCAGVDRAIEIVERALAIWGAPVFVLHEIVHNRHVLEDLGSRGVRFIDDQNEVPDGGVLIFSAHGVSELVEKTGRARDLRVIDATCPLVTNVQQQARRYAGRGLELILIGHPGHPEVEGTRGRIEGNVHVLSTAAEVEALEVNDPEHLAYVTQTTLSIDDTREVIDALEERFPTISGPDLADICYATQNRQNAVKDMVERVDLLLVVGSRNSSNSNRLRELGERNGLESHLCDHADQIEPAWLEGRRAIGVTAGASAPEALVQDILERLRELGVATIHEASGEPEDTVFSMPEALN